MTPARVRLCQECRRNEIPPDVPEGQTICEPCLTQIRAAYARDRAELAADVDAVQQAPSLAEAVRAYAEIHARRYRLRDLRHSSPILAALIDQADREERPRARAMALPLHEAVRR